MLEKTKINHTIALLPANILAVGCLHCEKKAAWETTEDRSVGYNPVYTIERNETLCVSMNLHHLGVYSKSQGKTVDDNWDVYIAALSWVMGMGGGGMRAS